MEKKKKEPTFLGFRDCRRATIVKELLTMLHISTSNTPFPIFFLSKNISFSQQPIRPIGKPKNKMKKTNKQQRARVVYHLEVAGLSKRD